MDKLKFFNILKDIFPNSNIQYNMPILNYTIDCFIPDGHIIIEYDKENFR